mgnify:CR=1 FL=1
MQIAGYNIFIPLEIGDVIQGQKYDTKYLVTDIQHTYSMLARDVIDVTLCLKNTVTEVESKVSYNYDTWKIIK